jgi:nitrogenase-stabilizing/protective protein
MNLEEFNDELEELVCAEDFLDYFAIPYDERVVKVNRLHILQRFHNYLKVACMPDDVSGQKAIYINALAQAYNDFVNSDAATEKVLRIYQRQNGTSFFDINKIGQTQP